MMPGARGNGRYGLSALRSDRGYLPALRIRSKSPTSSEPCAHREPAVAYAAGILCQYYPEMSRPTVLSSRLSWTYIMIVEAGEQRESSVSPLDDEEERLLLLLLVHPSPQPAPPHPARPERERRPLMIDSRAHRPQAIVASMPDAIQY